jgi:Uncharacterised MFS-type transporter YbfB
MTEVISQGGRDCLAGAAAARGRGERAVVRDRDERDARPPAPWRAAPGRLGVRRRRALFGNTFVGIVSLSLAVGAHLQFPRSVPLLTAGYGVGQVLGPLVAKPLLHGGYHDALLVAAAIVAAGAVAAAALRVRFPHRVGVMIEPSRSASGKE